MDPVLLIKKELSKVADKDYASELKRFFKTGKGEYGEGDRFIGVTVPNLRSVAKRHMEFLSLEHFGALLNSPIHEHRFLALVALVEKYKRASHEIERKKYCDFYIRSSRRVNNWDLVDVSAPYIAGEYCVTKGPTLLRKLARSKSLWERRIAIVATFAFIKRDRPEQAIRIAKILMRDKHDLIQKAVGWMLREAGKKNVSILLSFLDRNVTSMPRTMLRYAIERLPDEQRAHYLSFKTSRRSH